MRRRKFIDRSFRSLGKGGFNGQWGDEAARRKKEQEERAKMLNGSVDPMTYRARLPYVDWEQH